jgi:1-deoxy-D-xylulose-5-phosphate reductoisomerase
MDDIKKIVVLGSTGSIGRQTLDVVRACPGRFHVIGLAAGDNTNLLGEQIQEFQPQFYNCASPEGCCGVGDNGCQFISLVEMASLPGVDTVVLAVSGAAGLMPALAAAKSGKHIALANKESLVAAGEIIVDEVKCAGASILPVDSEHSAIWQCLNGEMQTVSQIILTASGGPFRQYSTEQLQKVTSAEALQHPSWQMGKKVTIDSATLMNKGLEIIEAHWLFDVPIDDIKVVIHPQSVIHSMVEFVDGSVKAQMSHPDMRLPIQYALSYPDRFANDSVPRVDWVKLGGLSFEAPDMQRFPCLRIAIEAGKAGGTYPAVLCAADEIAVEMFLSGRIGFTEIPGLIERVLERHQNVEHPGMPEIMDVDAWAREEALRVVKGDSL